MNSGTDNWLSNLTQALRADMKKTVSLVVLGLVFAVMLGKQVMSGGRSRPKAAAAAAVSPGSTDGSQTATGPSRASVAADALSAWTESAIQPVSRNLFAVRIEYFPLDSFRTSKSGVAEGEFWSSLEKSLTLRTDEKNRHENLMASFKAQAEKLQLQSTLPESRKAMINGQLVGEGSVVANFRVVKIEPRKVIVEREGIALEIKMK